MELESDPAMVILGFQGSTSLRDGENYFYHSEMSSAGRWNHSKENLI
jgi:hypothetical protein